MSESKRVLILTGSSRPGRTTSQSVGEYLAAALAERGAPSEMVRLRDGLILVFPLYVSTVSALVTRALETIAEQRVGGKRKPFVAFCQGGYPEARQSEAALAVCRLFARQAGFAWAGGLAFGGGAMVGGQPLEKMGWLFRHVRQALDMVAGALARGQAVPAEATDMMARSLLPTWLVLPMLNGVTRLRLYQPGALKNFRARPFAG